jgi:hypothetical protein
LEPTIVNVNGDMDDALTFDFNVLDLRVAALLDFALFAESKIYFRRTLRLHKVFPFPPSFSTVFCMSHFENCDC